MGLIKWQNSNSPSITNWFDEFFDKDPFNSVEERMMAPAVNVRETMDDFILEVATPGLHKKDIDIQVDKNNNLIISAEVQNEDKKKVDGDYTRREFSYSSFRRVFTLPESVEADKIHASHDNGMLVLVLPKKDNQKGTSNRTIKIN